MTPLYSDEEIAVAVKPRGALSEEGESGSFPALLREALGGEIYPVHRLDRETAGVMVYARNARAAAALSRMIAEGRFHKEYLAVAHGSPAQEKGELTDLLFFDRRSGKVYPVKRQRKGVKEARLRYRVLAEKEGLALLSVTPLTGRTHQIRVQFASRNHPLFGDRKYGGAGDGFGLWAHRIRFCHPVTGEEMVFTSRPDPVPPWTLFEEWI